MSKKNKYYGDLSYLQILEIDYFILKLLKKQFENKNIDFVDFKREITEEDFKKLKCNFEVLEKRLFFNIWGWFIDIDDIPSIREIKERCLNCDIDFKSICKKNKKKYEVQKDKYYSYFLEVKINSRWIEKISLLREEIKQEQKKNSLWGKIWKLFENYVKNYDNYKKGISIILTILVVFWTSLFGIKTLNLGKEIPIRGSILDIKKIDFEDVDKGDEYYTKLQYFLSDNEININTVEI